MPQLSGKPRTLGCLHEFLRCLCCAAHITSLSGFCGLFQLIGMLCINFDDSKYREASDAILKLCHPDRFVEAHVQIDESQFSDKPACPPAVSPESFHNSIGDVAEDAVANELSRLGVTADRLTPEERLKIVASLKEGGIFLLKGAVKDVAAALSCSQASIYRHLAQLKSEVPEE